MKIKLPTLTKTQKIIAAFAIATLIAFLVWGCGTAVSTEVKIDSTEMKIDSVKVDSVKVDTLK
jgi:hypothetical protein